MEVSHFELLFKAQAPADPEGGPTVDNVLQGYFLEITNLEPQELKFRIEFVTVPPAAGMPERGLEGNAICILDTPPGTDNQFGFLQETSDGVYRPNFSLITIPANGTALFAVLPDVFPGSPDMDPIGEPNFEVRGFVRLSLPALLDIRQPIFTSQFVPQSNGPVSVMLTPQNRASFFSGPTTISEQLQTGLPLASGQARNEIPADPGGPLVVIGDFDFDPVAAQASLDGPLNSLDLANLMVAVDPDAGNLKAFNKALKKAGAAIKLEKA